MSADGETDENSIEQPALHQSKSHPNSDSQRGASQAFGSQGARDSIPNRNTQRGVQDVEAVTLTWSKGTLIAMFIKYVGIHLGNVASRLICFSIWFLYFVSAFQLSVSSSLNPFVTSSFKAHSLSAVPTALGDAFAAATYLPMAKLMDVWGRAEGFLFMVLCLTVGLVIMAACNSFEAYCAANVRRQLLSGGQTSDSRFRSSTMSGSTGWNTQLTS